MSDAEIRRLEREAASGDEKALAKLEAARRRLGILLPWEDTNYVGGSTYQDVPQAVGSRLNHALASLRRMAEVRAYNGFGYGTTARLHLLDMFRSGKYGRIPTGILILRPQDRASRAFFGHMQFEHRDYIAIVFSEYHGQNDEETSPHYGYKWVDYGMNLSIEGSVETLGERYFDISVEWPIQYALEHGIPLRTGTVEVITTYSRPDFVIRLD
jgi:hypothetical protein